MRNAFISEAHLRAQWKGLHYLSKPDFSRAKEEYELFRNYLLHENIEIHPFPIEDSVGIDSIYCRDASIATDFGMILCNMGKLERINEPSSHAKTFEKNAFPILGKIVSPRTLEGR